MRWTGCRDHRTQPSVNGKALEQTSFVLGLRSETLFQGNILTHGNHSYGNGPFRFIAYESPSEITDLKQHTS
jgi:hypothetical protein